MPDAATHGLRQVEHSLPAAWYYAPEHYGHELERIWYRNWIYVGRAESIDWRTRATASSRADSSSEAMWIPRAFLSSHERSHGQGSCTLCTHRLSRSAVPNIAAVT